MFLFVTRLRLALYPTTSMAPRVAFSQAASISRLSVALCSCDASDSPPKIDRYRGMSLATPTQGDILHMEYGSLNSFRIFFHFSRWTLLFYSKTHGKASTCSYPSPNSMGTKRCDYRWVFLEIQKKLWKVQVFRCWESPQGVSVY